MSRKLVLIFVIFAVIILGLVVGWYVWGKIRYSSRLIGFVETPLTKSLLTFNQDKSYLEVIAKVIKPPYVSGSFGYVDISLADGRSAKAVMELVGSYGFSGLPKQGKTSSGTIFSRTYRTVNFEELRSLLTEGSKVKISIALNRSGYGLDCGGNLCSWMDEIVGFTKRFAENTRLVSESGEIMLGMASQFELLENISNE